MPPEQTLISLGLQEDDIMADIGCGIGYFTILASKIVGESGKIFAIDNRLDKMDLIKILDTLGFSDISTIGIGVNFYGIIAQK